MTVPTALDAAGRRRSPATVPGYHAGRPPNKGQLYPADPPTVEEIIGGDAPSSRRSPRRPPAGADRRALARRAARPGGARDWRARARFAPRVATRSPRQGWPCCARASALWFAPTRADEPNKAIEDGRVALGRGAWAEARVRFADALAQEETPEAFEGAGLAARYELDAEGAIEAHERGSAWPGRAGTPRVLHVSRSSSATTRMHFGGRLRPRAGLSAPRCSLRGSRRTLRPRGCQ
jgi:hypothetical protein